MSKKRIFSILATSCLLFIVGIMLTACGNVSFEIRFMVDNNVYAMVKTGGKETIVMPQNPTKTGYVFDGWYWDENIWQKPFTANSLVNEPLSSDMKVYAKWNDDTTPIGTAAIFNGFEKVDNSTYKISVANTAEYFNFNDYVTVDSSSRWSLHTNISATETIPSRTAELVVGDNTFYVLVTAANNDIKLYTVQVRRRPIYDVFFYQDNNYSMQKVEENSLAIKPQNDPIKTGYTFISWDYDLEKPITMNTYICPMFQANTYKIRYHQEKNNEKYFEQQVVYDEYFCFESGNFYSKIGYDVATWVLYMNETNKFCPNEAHVYNWIEDIDVYAIYIPTKYKIRFYHESYYLGFITYTIESNTFNLPTKFNGYEECNWYLDSDLTTKIFTIENGTHQNLDLYGECKLIDYSIEYVLNNGSAVNNPIQYNVEQEIILKKPKRNGYDFAGWYLEEDFLTKVDRIEKGSLGNKVLYAKWNAIFKVDDKGNAFLTTYGKTLNKIFVPNEIDDVLIKRIPSLSSDKLRMIEIADGIEVIVGDAWHLCANIYIILPKSINYIKFYGIDDNDIFIFYLGEQNQFVNINGYEDISSEKIYYYSETEKSGCWRYVNGVPTIWK